MAPYLDVDPDVTAARTPPQALYTDPAWHEALVRRVLHRGWHHLHAVAGAPDATVVPVSLAGEPLVFTSDGGTERLLSNVCTHRAAVMVDEPCRVHAIRCPYHGRRFRLDGTPTTAPGFDGPFPDGEALAAAALGRTGPWRWGSLAPAVPFDAWWAPVAERLPRYPWDALRRDPAGDREHALEAPWLAYVENYLEGLHVPFVHPELARALDLGAYRNEVLPHGTLQIGIAAPGEPALADVGEDRVAALYFWLFPATMVNVYPWGVSLNLVETAGLGRCVIRYRAWVADPSLRGIGAGGALDLVESQDQAVVARVARGLRSWGYRRGRYSPTHERGVHHFHRLLAGALA